MNGFGWDWATRTGGNLSAADKRRMAAPLLRSVPALAAERTRSALGRRGQGSLDLAATLWPDTRLAREAEKEAREVLSPHVLEHSYRSYLFGLVLAGLDGVRPEEDLAFTACMLHDLNLEQPTPGRCFAVVGAERTHAFVVERQPEVADRVAAGVADHLTPGVADDLSDLAGFVSAGALADVAGARVQEFDPAWLRDVLVAHPRYDFKRHLAAAIAEETRLVPDGRAAWLTRWARFQLLIKAAPFRE